MNVDIYLANLSYALGARAATVAESVAAKRTLSDEAAFLEAGFRQHWIAEKGTTAFDLALQSVEAIRDHLHGSGTIIYSTCLTCNGNLGRWEAFTASRDVKHLLDYPASHLQAELNLPQASVIGLNQQACTSVLGAIRLARGLMAAEPELSKILCVSADRFPQGALYEQSYNLISDGASAFTISRERVGYKVLATAAITNGAMARASDDETVGLYFNYTHQVIQQALAQAALSMDDISWVVPQNTNIKAWQILSSILRLDLKRVYLASIGDVAHIISSDNVVNLVNLEKTGKLRAGDRILICMAGYGLNWQAVIIEKV